MSELSPRGPLTAFLLEHVRDRVRALPPGPPPDVADPLGDDVLQLALYLCYELHFRGLPGVDERWEWDPGLLAWRRELEDAFEGALLERVAWPREVPGAADMDVALRGILDAAGPEEPSLSRHLERTGTLDQFREFVVHRSAYHLREADPHSFAIPRIDGRPKAALVEIQADEYGGGDPERIHARLFAATMRALGLDAAYAAYVERLPGPTLATVNLMSLFGLHRRWRGAIVGHLALFEMGSAVPNRRYGNGLRRLGAEPRALDFFDEHVEADAIHESIAAVDLAGGLAAQEPGLTGQILFGAMASDELDRRWAQVLLDAWEAGGTSLLEPLARAGAAA